MRSLYEILNLKHTASIGEIARAYHKKSREYNLYKNPNAAKEFQAVTKAYVTLSNPITKKLYDFEVGGGSGIYGGINYSAVSKTRPTLNSESNPENEPHNGLKVFTKRQINADILKDEDKEGLYNYYRSHVFFGLLELYGTTYGVPELEVNGAKVWALIHLMAGCDAKDIGTMMTALSPALNEHPALVIDKEALIQICCATSLTQEKKLNFINSLEQGKMSSILQDSPKYELAKALEGLNPHELNNSKMIKEFFSPDLFLRMASFFDLIPPLALFVPIVGWAYIGARIGNGGSQLTNQRYSLFPSLSEEKGYTEAGLEWQGILRR